ncbi:probable RNA polymerase II nuclear localization protein SLC7A6OS [Anolis carolinensis]|uniref:Probable RNA polymerase II nuclear localization protein SLC7A6OS n=1 Tax=Anolis carolinensis TaxID=28377 RepID=H9GG60_ANOCA|nr:PREDICTED: probable RNA polymerase II nuclear localization protein SLC7A6OS [Anolis carolinensis]|eukprot:XP_003222994.2 PREDICTED: probable RNA polymerase II nuclear localization protein SLC7A6OS [Anolis carolinensis]
MPRARPSLVAMERAAVLRVKRKRGGPLPVEALVLACKRLRTEAGTAAPATRDEVEENLFKLVATVTSEDEPVQKYVQDAITKQKAAQLLRPSQGSVQRVIENLRSSKKIERQESRYRLVASHRPNFTDGENAVSDTNGEKLSESNCLNSGTSQQETSEISGCCSGFQLFDIIQEDEEEKDPVLQKQDDPDVILCNAVEMIRERLVVSDREKEEEQSSKDGDYVYDIYYMETTSPGWIENILSVQPYTQDCELVDEERISEEIYEDEDDENNENNWRNEYPDEDDFLPEGDEDESDKSSLSDEDGGYIRRTWEKYQSDVLREFEYDGLEELDSE